MYRGAPLLLQQLGFMFLLFVCLMFAVTVEVTLPLCTSFWFVIAVKFTFMGKFLLVFVVLVI